MDLSDEEYDRCSDSDVYESDSEQPVKLHDSTPSSPPSVRGLGRGPRPKNLPCSYRGCNKTFTRKSRLEEHIRAHENIRLFKCTYPDCGREYLRQSHLNHHTKTAHTGIRDWVCTWKDCGKSFTTGTRLRRHEASHAGREKFRCRGFEGCDQTFRKHETLKRHILTTHHQMRPYPCTETHIKTGEPCAKAFDTMEKLRNHQRINHDAFRFTCTDCLSRTSQPLGEGETALPDAAAHFATYSELQTHIAEAHPPTCEYCPTSFQTVKELSRHLEIQHGWVDPNTPQDSKFTCDHAGCGRVFTKKGNLNVHVKTVHEKKKDFVCGETILPRPEEFAEQPDIEVFGCGRAFTSKASLEDHVRSAHLGLTSRLVERRHKRKADMAASRQTDGDSQETMKKKPRKDKGTKKTSAATTLTGQALVQDSQELPFRQPISNGYTFSERYDAETSSVKDEEEGDVDEWNQLSSSMVLFEDHIYHNGQEYQLMHGQLQAVSPPLRSNNITRPQGSPPEFAGTHGFADLSNPEDEPVFDNFEHEPEYMSGFQIDPVLLRS